MLVLSLPLIHSKVDYCNSLLLNFPATQTNHLQLSLNSAACVVTKTPKFHHISPSSQISSLAQNKWENSVYKVLSLTYKSLQIGKPCYLRSLFSFTPNRSTRSSSFVTMNRPSYSCRLKITNRSFYQSAPALWNTSLCNLRQLFCPIIPSQPIFNSPTFALFIALFFF